MSHAFSTFFLSKENLQMIFKKHFEESRRTVETMNLIEVRDWLERSKPNVLEEVSKNTLKAYFGM
jgi:hypothetical protein